NLQLMTIGGTGEWRPAVLVMTRVIVLRMRVADDRTHNFVANIQSEHLPEVPPPAIGRLTTANPLRQATKDPDHDDRRQDLQDHELCNLKPEHVRQGNVNSERQFEIREVIDVMKGSVLGEQH